MMNHIEGEHPNLYNVMVNGTMIPMNNGLTYIALRVLKERGV